MNSAKLSAEDSGGTRPLSVRLIDDNPDDIVLIECLARLFQFPVSFSSSTSLVPSKGPDPDVVLLDMNLVESKGMETFARASELFSRSAIILLTGVSHQGVMMECLKGGAQDFLIKGEFNESGLEKAVRFAHERNQQRIELKESRAALELVLDAHPIGLMVLGEDLCVKQCNAAASQLLGSSVQEIVGEPSPVPLEEGAVTELQLENAEGEMRSLEVRSSRRDVASRTGGDLFVALTDVTERRSEEQQTSERKKLETVARVCYGVAHEFNNLLAITHTKTDLLADSVRSDPVWSAHIDDLKHACDRGSRLVRQLMTFYGRPSSGEDRLVLSEFLEQNRDQLEMLGGPFHRLDLVCLAKEVCVKTSSSSLLKILLRLVANACEATSGGGCIKVLADASGDIGFGSKEGYACISVEDEGAGIAEIDKPKIFEPFFTTKDTKAGRGLGLSVVSNLLRELGGWIEFDSTVGQGSKFRVYLPVAGEPQAVEDEPVLEQVSSDSPTEVPLVLVVDDEPIIRFSVERLLEAGGYRAISAEDGPSALAILEEDVHDVRLLLTDLNMPLMHGKELVDRACYLNPKLRVLVMSGFGSSGVNEDWLKAKGAKFIAKPFAREKLLAHVSELLGRPYRWKKADEPLSNLIAPD